MPSATTRSRWKRLQGSRSIRAGTSLRTTPVPASRTVPAAAAATPHPPGSSVAGRTAARRLRSAPGSRTPREISRGPAHAPHRVPSAATVSGRSISRWRRARPARSRGRRGRARASSWHGRRSRPVGRQGRPQRIDREAVPAPTGGAGDLPRRGSPLGARDCRRAFRRRCRRPPRLRREALRLPPEVFGWPVARLSTASASASPCCGRSPAIPASCLLDEPTAALDPDSVRGAEAVIEARRAAGLIVVLVSHDPAQVARLTTAGSRWRAGVPHDSVARPLDLALGAGFVLVNAGLSRPWGSGSPARSWSRPSGSRRNSPWSGWSCARCSALGAPGPVVGVVAVMVLAAPTRSAPGRSGPCGGRGLTRSAASSPRSVPSSPSRSPRGVAPAAVVGSARADPAFRHRAGLGDERDRDRAQRLHRAVRRERAGIEARLALGATRDERWHRSCAARSGPG